jgi:hypothetical protein
MQESGCNRAGAKAMGVITMLTQEERGQLQNALTYLKTAQADITNALYAERMLDPNKTTRKIVTERLISAEQHASMASSASKEVADSFESREQLADLNEYNATHAGEDE